MITLQNDLDYIKENLDIDTKKTSKAEALALLKEHEISTTSWVLSALTEVYGEAWAEEYKESIAKDTCYHGFLGQCPYCKWGTE